MLRRFFPDQMNAINAAETHRFILWVGGMGGGKSVGAAAALIAHSVAETPSGKRKRANPEYLVAGRTLATAERNLIGAFKDIAAFTGAAFKRSRMPSKLTIGDATFHFMGADNEESAERARGANLNGALLDELAVMPLSFLQMIVSRVRVKPNPVLIATLNKTQPAHWVKTEYYDKAHLHDDWLVLDTPAGNPEIDMSGAEGMLYGAAKARLLDNKWAAQEGLVYPHYSTSSLAVNNPQIFIAADYGQNNPTAALYIQRDRSRDRWHIVGEYYSDQRLTIAQHVANIISGAKRIAPGIAEIVVDPSALGMKIEIRRAGYNVTDADNAVDDGIQATRQALESKRMVIDDKRTPALIREIETYQWDERAAARGIERPLKQNDHATDALRYFCHTTIPRPLRATMTTPLPPPDMRGWLG